MNETSPLLHDQTFANVNEVLGTGTTTFDTNVLVKVEEAVKWAGSKSSQSSENSQYSSWMPPPHSTHYLNTSKVNSGSVLFIVKFLQKVLEPFTPPVVPRSAVAPQATLSASGSTTPLPAVEQLPALIHPHASLCTLSLVGPHRLTDAWFEATSHLTSITTLKLYELHAPGRETPTSDAWALGDALNHAPWLPKLEWVYVQRGLASGLRDEEVWDHIVTACGKRGVHLLEEPNGSQ